MFTTYYHFSFYLLIAAFVWLDFLAPVSILCLAGLAVCLLSYMRKRQTGKTLDLSATSIHEKTSIMEDLDREARRRKEVEQLERN